MKNRLAYIGASGFVGTRLIEITKDDFEISNFDKLPSRSFSEISVIGDVRNLVDLDKELKDKDVVVLLAAEHRDDVSPVSLYYDVNVKGTENVLTAMDNNDVKSIIFTSSVAVYGLDKDNPNEFHPVDPFNDYGQSKWEAEKLLQEWYQKDPEGRSLTIIRPTVIFGEHNRGNVYNLLRQIVSGKFMMIGKGDNYKSMAYVGNVAAFIKYRIENLDQGSEIFNYVDKPDMSMNLLIKQVEESLHKGIPSVRLPYWLGMFGGYCFDLLSIITRKKFTVSSVRVKKFCATTQFDSSKVHSSGFKAPLSLKEGLRRTIQQEFVK